VSGDRSLADLITHTVDVRTKASELANATRKLTRLVKTLAAQPDDHTPRPRRKFKIGGVTSQSLAIAALASGLSIEEIATRANIPIVRIGMLFRGVTPTNTEREALQRLLPTWVE
jgi:hypothetical protein